MNEIKESDQQLHGHKQSQTPLQMPPQKPISKFTHFGLSFLAVIVGIPVSLGAFMVFGVLFIVILISIATAGSGSNSSNYIVKQPQTYEYAYGKLGSRNRLVSVPIFGVIASQSATGDSLSSIFGGGFADGEKIKGQLISLSKDPSVKGVILEIDSPGGQVTASKAISDGAKAVRDAKKPIIAHINGLGASGGYWSAASTDYIMAETGSLSGSVGVILGDLPYYKNIVSIGGVTTTEPIKIKSFSAGISKDIGNPYRETTDEETAFLNKSLQSEYEIFTSFVSERRKIPKDTLKNDIKALPYGNTEALHKKLIDKVGSKEEAYQELASRANVHDDFVVDRTVRRSNFFGGLFSAITHTQAPEAQISQPARDRYCATIAKKPLVLDGPLSSICR